MENIWEILKIEETKDSRAIKRAYASLAREYNPEEHPQEFLHIREAYERAMAYAEGSLQVREPSGLAEKTGRQAFGAEEEMTKEKFSDEKAPKASQIFQWNFMEENPYREHPAVVKFRELYTGKRRKDRTVWMDYFVSDDFLEVWREKGFAAELLAIVKEYQETYPPSREFLTELYLAYGIRCQNMRMLAEDNAAFHGIEHIMEIAGMGPAITRFKGNDQAVIEGFRDYRKLLRLSSEESWDDSAFLRLSEIIDRYRLGNISDRPIQNARQYELYQRHPKSLRLIGHFFAYTQLPVQAYRLLWNHLHLDSATDGKNKLFYGSLRDTVIARLPELLEKPRVSYQELNKDYGRYVYYSVRHGGEESGDGKEAAARKEINAFFAREDVQCALMDERYVEEQVLHYWINKKGDTYFTHCLEEFFRTHNDAPYRERVLEVIGEWNTVKQIETEYLEDEQSLPEHGFLDFRRRPYVRFYLNTAFHLTCGARSGVLLPEYLRERFPYSAAWAKSFTDPVQGGFSPECPVEIRFGENIIRIIFHLRYLEYRWNEDPVGPLLSWDTLKEIQDETAFWLLLPITLSSFQEYPEIYQELTGRLSRLPLHQEDIPVIADCICGRICQFAEDTENKLPLWTLYSETEELLYGCDIYRNGTLSLYEETAYNKKLVPNGQYQAVDMDTAVSMAERLLRELTASYSVTASVALMPGRIFVRNHWNQPSSLEGGQVNGEALQELLEGYFEGKLNRLELAWEKGALVFINQKGRYACLYFDELKSGWYALVGMPEVYARADIKDVIYVPFGLGALPDYLVHRNLNFMKKHLNEILDQIACVPAKPKPMMWAAKVYRFERKLQYHLAKRLFGGYTAEQTRNQLTDRFYIPVLPNRISYTDTDGNLSENLQADASKAAVQDALSRYMAGELSELTLTWQDEEAVDGSGAQPLGRHIVLLQDQGRHQLLYLDSRKQELDYLVADVEEYRRAEGKKFRRTSFRGKTVPGYLVHENLTRIRDYLDLLIPQIRCPDAVLGMFGEFSYAGREKFEEAVRLV